MKTVNFPLTHVPVSLQPCNGTQNSPNFWQTHLKDKNRLVPHNRQPWTASLCHELLIVTHIWCLSSNQQIQSIVSRAAVNYFRRKFDVPPQRFIRPIFGWRQPH